MVSSTEGSPTYTGWKRRSRAASFSMYLRYSSSVVAPIMRSSPRASIGLSMLPASMAPFGGAGAHDRVQLVDEGDDLALGVGDLLEHGLQPLLELAAVLGAGHHRRRGRATTSRLCLRLSGTSPSAMRRARPSTMAVLPTPGSPISTGLFLVRRDSTWMTRRISSSRPMTGSILPSRAAWVRSRPYCSSAWNCSSGFWLVTRWLPAHLAQRAQQLLPADAEAVGHGQQQVLGRQVVVAQLLAGAPRPGRRRPWSPGSCGGRWCRRPWAARPTASSARLRTMSGARPSFCSTGRTIESSWRSSAASRWSGVSSGLALVRADSRAAATACWVLVVHFFGSSAIAVQSTSVTVKC